MRAMLRVLRDAWYAVSNHRRVPPPIDDADVVWLREQMHAANRGVDREQKRRKNIVEAAYLGRDRDVD